MVTETRVCGQCGAVFTPRREHARFCSAGCRMVWHQERTGDPIAGDSVLEWSVPAMSQAVRALVTVSGWDRTAGCAAVSDAVWAVTMVDAAMVRRHPGIYDEVLAGELVPDRRLVEESLAGLRFVRNRIPDHAAVAGFVAPSVDDPDEVGVLGWQWQSVSRPPLTRRRPRAQAWETARYEAYQTRLAGCPLGEVFQRAEAFLLQTAEGAAVIAGSGADQAVGSAAAGRRAQPGR